MALGTQIAQDLPYLRRYARALTGSQGSGDALVRATLEAALANAAQRAELEAGRVALYRLFTALLGAPAASVQRPGHAGSAPIAAAQARLGRVAPRSRQALLLTTLEEFSPAEAAQVMNISAEAVVALAQEATRDIARDAATSVLVIEDEPLIAMQLEDLVRSLGHSICGSAATRAQARQIAGRCRPGLVLADIQLADCSSGLDAVDDILAGGDVPVIFITAFPERLLTGDRPEPTYLVTKPFREEVVRATISQALFFTAPAPAA